MLFIGDKISLAIKFCYILYVPSESKKTQLLSSPPQIRFVFVLKSAFIIVSVTTLLNQFKNYGAEKL